MADLRPLEDWSGPPASLTLWEPSAASVELARSAPPSPVPPSFEQEQHLRAYRACEQRNEGMARLLVVVWEEAGRCDLRVMGHVITAHLRRHDTYHSRFEESGAGFVRHVIAAPERLVMEPRALGEVDMTGWQGHVAATPAPVQWDCFRFGVLQRAGGFTCFASIDHLHADSTVIAILMEEIRGAYRAAIDGQTPQRQAQAGRYLDYCAGQRARAAGLTLSHPDVAGWVDFLHRNGGRMPPFPLPLGAPEDRCLAEHRNVDILDAAGAAAFEAVCQGTGARMIGGLMACAALTERKLAGTLRYAVVTPTTTRKAVDAVRTTGWCMGVVPVDFDSTGEEFATLAPAAQRVFDGRAALAQVPVERVIELAAGLETIRPAATGGVMLSFMDTALPPLGAHIARDWDRAKGRVYINQGMSAQVALWFFRTGQGLTLTAAYPANATARASMQAYIEALRDVCRGVVDTSLPAFAAVSG